MYSYGPTCEKMAFMGGGESFLREFQGPSGFIILDFLKIFFVRVGLIINVMLFLGDTIARFLKYMSMKCAYVVCPQQLLKSCKYHKAIINTRTTNKFIEGMKTKPKSHYNKTQTCHRPHANSVESCEKDTKC